MVDRNLSDFLTQLHHGGMSESLRMDLEAGLLHRQERPQTSNASGVAWTQANINAAKDRITQMVGSCIAIFLEAKDVNDYANEDFLGAISRVKAAYTSTINAPGQAQVVLRDQIVKQLTESSALQTLATILHEQLLKIFNKLMESSQIDEQLCYAAFMLLDFFFFFADTSVDFAIIVTDESSPLLKCVDLVLERFMVPHFLNLTKTVDDVVFSGLALSYNLVRHENSEIIRRVREGRLMESMRPYLSSKVERFRVVTLLSMVYVAQESNAMYYCSDQLVIKYLYNKLIEATNSPIKTAAGFTAMELMKALGKLAALDFNKPFLKEIGTVNLMGHFLRKGTPEEVKGGLQILTQLAFDKNLALDIGVEISNSGIDRIFQDQSTDNHDPEIRKAVHGLFWVITENRVVQSGDDGAEMNIPLISRPPSQDDSSDAPAIATGDRQPHVMISYQWDCQEKVRKICNYLKEKGFEVWYDEENMGSNLLDSMSFAVENAFVVLICYSRKYQFSHNTRSEAEYAHKHQKRMVFARMEEYDPDGWLGLILGQSKYHEFCGKENEITFAKLAEDLRSAEMPQSPPPSCRPGRDDVDVEMRNVNPSRASNRDVSHWTVDAVARWLADNNVCSDSLGSLSGKELQLLVDMRRESPETFHRYVLKTLGLQGSASLVAALKQL